MLLPYNKERPMTTPISKEHAFDVINCLTSNMHEGFHGTLYEMSDELRRCDPTVFDRQIEIDRADSHLIEGAKWYAEQAPGLFDEEEYDQFFIDYRASMMYRYVVAQMIDVVIDETSTQLNTGRMGLLIRSDGVGDSLPLLKSILDDMILCIENDDDDTIVATPFNREFFYSRAPGELKDIPDPDPLTLSQVANGQR